MPEVVPLSRDFYEREAPDVARELIGHELWRESDGVLVSGIIVETEAYLGANDEASHSYRGPTKRNAAMFGPPGHAYVYTIHTRFCFNVVTQPEGVASAVLVRAVEPRAGIEHMRGRRRVASDRLLTRGPGRLCEAFSIDRRLDGWDLTRGELLWIARPREPVDLGPVTCGPRIGLSRAKEMPLRFYVVGNRFVS